VGGGGVVDAVHEQFAINMHGDDLAEHEPRLHFVAVVAVKLDQLCEFALRALRHRRDAAAKEFVGLRW
jgi:hypothetical protein